MESGREGYTEFSRICDDLGITPAQLREIISTFGDLIGVRDVEGQEPREEAEEEPWKDLLRDDDPGEEDEPGEDTELSQGIPSESVGVIADILRLRNDGLPDADIRKALVKDPSETEGPENRLESKIERLVQEIDLSERRRAEDRDRMLTALMRTHQEVRQLRNEIAAQNSRRARKKSFLARLFGL